MNITIDREKLLWGLDLVSKVSTKHQTLPVLQCVFIEVKDQITLKATNLEIGIEVTLDAESSGEGSVAVPATTLHQTIGLLSQKKISLSTKEGVLVVESTHATTNIKTLPHDEFPTIPQLKGGGQQLNGSLFGLGIKTAAFAASQSSIKPELGSIYIHQKKEHTLTFVATDSFRLVEKTTPQRGITLENPILIPFKNAVEIARVVEFVGADPEFRVSENQCSLLFAKGSGGAVYITSRLTEGTFPDYTQIIPKEFSAHVTLLRADLIHALKKTNIFTNKFMQVSLTIEKEKGTLLLNSDNGELGTTSESIEATVEGKALALSFNQHYLSEPLSYFTDDSVTLHFAGVGRPVVVEGISEKSLRYLVMPMNK